MQWFGIIYSFIKLGYRLLQFLPEMQIKVYKLQNMFCFVQNILEN